MSDETRQAEVAEMAPSAGPSPSATRAEAEELWDYKRLRATGRDVENHGKGRLVITYAGRNPQRIQIRCRSGKAAKRTQMLLRRDLMRTESDAQYNAVIDAFFAAIRDAQGAENAED